MPACIKRQILMVEKKKKNLLFVSFYFVTQPQDLQKHSAVNPLFGNGYESVQTIIGIGIVIGRDLKGHFYL